MLLVFNGSYHFHRPEKERNRRRKAINGNGQARKMITIAHWNLGAKRWQKKMEEIEILSTEKLPDLLFITEANLFDEVPDYSRYVEGYQIILPNTMEHLRYVRIILLVRNGIQVEVMTDCMEQDLSVIWVKVGRAGRRPLVVGGIYREQHLLRQGTPNLTDAMNCQEDRWNRTVLSWKRASRNAECIVTGDLNLDFLNWDNPLYNLRMIEKIKLEIETLGFVQLVQGFTRTWPGNEDSCVDHFWSNGPERIISVQNLVRAGSDHNLIMAVVRMERESTGEAGKSE